MKMDTSHGFFASSLHFFAYFASTLLILFSSLFSVISVAKRFVGK
jgi:hypothetical protein